MHRVLLIVALAGCDQLWNLDHVGGPHPDARPIDAGPTCFEDTFEMQAIDAGKWTDYADAPASIAVMGNELVMTLGTYDGSRYAGVYGNKSDFSGAMTTVEVLEVPTANNGVGGAVLVMQLARDTENSYAVLFDRGRLFFRERVANAEQVTNIPYNATEQRFWGLQHDRDKNDIIYLTSRDGLSWNRERSTAAMVSVADVRIEIFAGTYDQLTAPGRARVDNVRVAGCKF